MNANIPFYRYLCFGVNAAFSFVMLSVWFTSLFYSVLPQEAPPKTISKNTQQTAICYLIKPINQNFIIECYRLMVSMIWMNK